MDALSEVLRAVRLESTIFCRSELGAPWGVRLEGGKLAAFHYVVRGSSWLTVDKMKGPPVALTGGDLVLLPLGHAHVLRDHPRSPVRRLEDILAVQGDATVVRAGGNGAASTVISGCMTFERGAHNPLLLALPPMIRISADEGRAVPWLEHNLQFIAAESASDRPGAQLVLARIADVVFVQALRAFIERLPDDSDGFLRALREPHIGAALGLMHESPEVAWSVASLATKVGMSRTVFAQRFKRLVGESPLAYLTRVRMQRAAVLLRTGATLQHVAERTGYSSEVALSHAFRQWSGEAPGAYRRRTSDAPADDMDGSGRSAAKARTAPRRSAP